MARVMVTGRRAVNSIEPLFVRCLDGRWVPCGPHERKRAARMEERTWWIYGVERGT